MKTRRILIPLLVLALLCACLPAMAAGVPAESVKLETGKLKVYDAADPLVADLLAPDGEPLPVLVVPAKKSLSLKVTTLPKNAANKKVVLTSGDESVFRVSGMNLNAKQPGEALLTIANAQNPDVCERYRVLVVRPVSRITLAAPERSVPVGGQMALTASFTPADATLPKVAWTSENEKIATVDENGVVSGIKRGNVRINASALDGSNTRASISVRVTQPAQAVNVNSADVTVAAGRNVVVKATVSPQDTDDKTLVWTSSDERVAKVNNQGRITGVALGDCEITCASKADSSVKAVIAVHVQQPVTKITFDGTIQIFAGETGKLSWTVEPANASNTALTLTSGNKGILTVDNEGNVVGLRAGETHVTAVSTDGSNRRARVKVKVLQHVTGVHMTRRTAYIDVGETASTSAVLEPKNASIKDMTWSLESFGIADVTPQAKQSNRVKIKGLQVGETRLTGVTADGGFEASMVVKVGHWQNALKLREAHVSGADVYLTVRNDSELTITSITAEVSVYDVDGNPVPANSQNDSNTFKVVYKRTLYPGETTREQYWKYVNFKLPASTKTSEYVVKITQFQIDNDWVKVIPKRKQPTKHCPVHI